MANKFKVINNLVNDNLVGLQFAADGGTPLFTVGNFQIETTFSEKQTKDYTQGQSSEYFTLETIGETTEDDNILRKNKTKLILNPNYNNPKTYTYFSSIREYFRVNVEGIITKWPASIYVNKIINTFTGDTVESYYYDPVSNISTFYVNNSFFNNYFDIKYVSQYNSNDNLDNPLRNLNVEYSKYTIFYENVEYTINSYTGSTEVFNDYVYFEVIGNPFPLATGGTFSTNYHIKPNSVEVEKFFSSLEDLSKQLLDRYVVPIYTSNFTYIKPSDQGPYDIVINQIFTWPVIDGYNLDIVTSGYTDYITNLYQFCDYFDENETNIMNRMLVSESINRLNLIRRGDGSEDENEAEKVTKLINIFAREFDEVKKYIDGLSYINTVTYDKNGNTPDSLIKNLSKTNGWQLLRPMSDVNLISSFIPTQSVYSGYTINYSNYDAEIEFWRRLLINTAHIFKSKGSRKAIEFIFDFIGSPEQLVSFNEYVYIAKKPINVEIFKLILNELTGFNDITPFNVDEDGFPKILPETPYNYYQSDGLWYRETAGIGTNLNIFEGNNPHIGPYDGGKSYINQFKCLIDTFSATSVSIFSDYIVFTNLFKNYSDGLVNDYVGQVYLNSYDLDGKPNICFTVTGTVITDPDPEDVLSICGCPISVSDHALVLGVKKNNSFVPCSGVTRDALPTQQLCEYSFQGTKNNPPLVLFSGNNLTNVLQVPKECCKSNSFIDNVLWVETANNLGYCYWSTYCGELNVIGSLNGSLIFSTINGNTGLTSNSLGISSSSFSNCCQNFGGTPNSETGECELFTNEIPQTLRTTSPINSGTNVFGSISDLGNITQKVQVSSKCPDLVAVSSNGVVIDPNTQKSVSSECCNKIVLGFNALWDGKECLVSNTECQLSPIKDLNNNLILNSDGTISFIDNNNVIKPPTSECCNAYSTSNLPLTFCGGKCYWVNPSQNCSQVDDFKVSLGVDGNDGIYLLSGSNETCYFQVEFDMLINFNCSEFLDCVEENNILSQLSGFTINATIESISGSTSTKLQTFPAFNFNINNKPTGIYFSGEESVCNALNEQILLELGDNCSVVTDQTFGAKWVNVKFNISNQIIGEKIKLGFEFINVPCNFNFLLDNIKIERLCVVTNEDILNINNCFGFDLDRVVDNKKSWDYTETNSVRSVDYLDYRYTYYNEKDSRLLINSKEVDITLDAAKAIENDVFCYIVKNDCFFSISGVTIETDPYLFKYKDEIDSIDNLTSFKDFILTRLVDPKSRQVIRNYPLLRYVFNKYLNLCDLNKCDDLGNQYNYDSLQSFIKLIGDYWIELVEQLVPSTSLWKGATRYYRNTIFDQPKYKYKNYSLLTCQSDCTSMMMTGDTDCVLFFDTDFLQVINKQIKFLDDPKNGVSSEIVNCWLGALNLNEQVGLDPRNTYSFSDLPKTIQGCITSSGQSLDLITLSVNATVGSNQLFDEVVITGETIADVTGITSNLVLNTIQNGFINSGYTVTYTGETFYVTSPNNEDCDKNIEINFCYQIDLSCLSGNTSYPDVYSGSVVSATKSFTDMDLCITNNSLYLLNGGGYINIFDCSTNTFTSIIGSNLGSPLKIKYDSVNNNMYFTYISGGISNLGIIDCATNIITNITLPFNCGNSNLTYNSTNNSVYITDYYGNNIYIYDVATQTLSTTPIYVGNNIVKPKSIEYNPNNNTIYCSGSLLNSSAELVIAINCVNNSIIPTISYFSIFPIKFIKLNVTTNELYILEANNTNTMLFVVTNSSLISVNGWGISATAGAFSFDYTDTYDKVYLPKVLNGVPSIDIVDISNTQNLNTISSVSNTSVVYKIIYNQTENLVYTLGRDRVEIVEPTLVSTTLTASCINCNVIYTNKFETLNVSGNTEFFDCNKCVGLENNGIEVIIEAIEIPTGTGSTSTNCIENKNITTCSEVFIKSINDDPTFMGRITQSSIPRPT